MLQHFRGNLDSWDPALVDRLAQDREVILLDNRGVGGSTGVVPEDVTAMARDALAFIDGLGLKQIVRAVVAVRDVSESRERRFIWIPAKRVVA
jgi:pimeloyl-ACP methyl ester carboxylesterase